MRKNKSDYIVDNQEIEKACAQTEKIIEILAD